MPRSKQAPLTRATTGSSPRGRVKRYLTQAERRVVPALVESDMKQKEVAAIIGKTQSCVSQIRGRAERAALCTEKAPPRHPVGRPRKLDPRAARRLARIAHENPFGTYAEYGNALFEPGACPVTPQTIRNYSRTRLYAKAKMHKNSCI